MRESVSYAKLRDESWGIRVATQGRHPSPGDTIAVNKRDGSQNMVTLGSIVDRDRGAFPGPAVYYRIAKRPGNGTRPSRPAADPALTNALRVASATARALIEYDPAKYEWFDGETEIQEAHEEALVASRDAAVQALRDLYRRTTNTSAKARIEVAAKTAKAAKLGGYTAGVGYLRGDR